VGRGGHHVGEGEEAEGLVLDPVDGGHCDRDGAKVRRVHQCSVVKLDFQHSSISSKTRKTRSATTQRDQRLRPAQGKVD